MSSATFAHAALHAILAQAMAEYVVTTLGRSAHAVGDALDAGWSFVTANPWTVGIALVVLIFLGRK